jgi:hypothetical protein
MPMRGNWVSIVLAFVCIGFVVGAVLSFTVPYQEEEMILWGPDFGIVANLKAPFHTEYPMRSYNQSIHIDLHCTKGSLDIVVLKTTEWDAWDQGDNYSAYFEAKNVTDVMTTIEVSPPYSLLIDIILVTNYGDAWMSVDLSSHWMGFDDSTGMNSLLLAIPFTAGSFYYANKKPKKDDNSIGVGIS